MQLQTNVEFENDSILKIVRNLGTIKMDTFKQRTTLQKLAYLSQKLNNDHRYAFSWYGNGPFSKTLSDYLHHGLEVDRFLRKPKLTKQELKTVSSLKKLLGKDINNPKNLVLYASIWHFLETNTTKREILRIVCEEQFYFEKRLAERILNKIIKFKKEYKY